jgi:hypothetical protein
MPHGLISPGMTDLRKMGVSGSQRGASSFRILLGVLEAVDIVDSWCHCQPVDYYVKVKECIKRYHSADPDGCE